jgi:hypothetical protein
MNTMPIPRLYVRQPTDKVTHATEALLLTYLTSHVCAGDGLKEQLEALRVSHAAAQHKAAQQVEELTDRCSAAEAAAAEATRKHCACPLLS